MNLHTGIGLLGAVSALSLTACGGSDPNGGGNSPTGTTTSSGWAAAYPKSVLPADLLPTLPVVAPTSALDIPVFSDIVEIAPSADETFCTFTNVTLDKDTIFGESFGVESAFGHHAILQYTTTPQAPGTGPCGAMDASMLLGGSGGRNVSDKATLPTNFGVSVPAGAQLVINHHWINTSADTIKGQAMMLARPLPEGGNTVLAGNFPMLGLGWEIPARNQYTYSTSCTYTNDVSYVLALGHMHEFGTHVNIEVDRADGSKDTLIDEDWSAESGTTAGGKIYTLDDPYVIHKGDTAKLTCNWDNSTDAAIDFPREMCIFFGYTIGTNDYCVNGSWMTPDQVGAANAQQITSHL